MSLYSLPILIINLGGEMFYILDQRLKAQNIHSARADQVLNEITTALFDEVFIHDIFHPQSLYSKEKLYTLFKDIAHASIMKLNDPSMQKLFDLMLMVFKYQLYHARNPQELLLITLNHLNSLHNRITSSHVHKQLHSAYCSFKKYYKMTEADLQRIRYDLMNYFQDMRIKISILLKQGLQNSDGTFNSQSNQSIPYNRQTPGVIQIFNNNGLCEDKILFKTSEIYKTDHTEPCYEFPGNTGFSLGLSIYEEGTNNHETRWSQNNLKSYTVKLGEQNYRGEINSLKQELIGTGENIEKDEMIVLDVFTDSISSSKNESSHEKTVQIVTFENESDRRNSALETAAAELTIDENKSTDTAGLLYLLENI